MFAQIILGSTIIFITLVIQVLFISSATQALTQRVAWLVKPPHILRHIISLVAVVLWLIVGISLSAWAWAWVFMLVEALPDWDTALYFSIVTFTTLGYGDVTLADQWRILGSFSAVNGLIIFGLNTAFLVEFTTRLRQAQESKSD